MYINSRN